MFRKSNDGRTDLWGVDMSKADAREIKALFNDPRWVQFMEPWLDGLINVYRTKMDDCPAQDVVMWQADIRAVKKLRDLRSYGSNWKLD